jgi:catechol 2,3-dioxygenase-like lactoylglutathione lyase family enzyme
MSNTFDVKLNHVHARVRDLGTAVSWFETILGLTATYRNDRLAVFSWSSFSLLLDASEIDSTMTLGFESRDCDADFGTAVAKGAVALESPADRPWGARAAYLRGPGALTVEFEQPKTAR